MNPAFVAAAIVLVVCLVALTSVALWAEPTDGIPALQLAGAVTTMALVCLAVGLESTAMTGVALICGVMTWLGGLVYVRFMDREP
ncbi:MAG TPA: monovalent cation/H+ antiporter complex subunit F [Nocardioidaceae bacterium]|nr:monovalent cation/H+ antiporter complex subunit F [Nocardioidaceae bacterium]